MDKGRPTTFTHEIADSICEQIATTQNGLRTICRNHNIEPKTLFNWMDKDKDFLQQYTRAKELQAEFMVEEMLDIADDAEGDDAAFVGINRIHRAKLQIETRKWIAAKLKPKRFGEKIDVTSDGEKLQAGFVAGLPTEKLAQLEKLLQDDNSGEAKID